MLTNASTLRQAGMPSLATDFSVVAYQRQHAGYIIRGHLISVQGYFNLLQHGSPGTSKASENVSGKHGRRPQGQSTVCLIGSHGAKCIVHEARHAGLPVPLDSRATRAISHRHEARSGRDAGYVALISMGVTLDKDGLVIWARARDEVGLSAVCLLLYHRCCSSCLILHLA